MFDLYVDPASGDLAFDKGGLRLVKAPNKRVRQELETTLRTFQGEWFNNLSFGGINRAYIGRIGVTKEEVDAWYRRTILANPEVLELVEFESSWNRQTRRYELEFTVRTASGTESSLITISPEASTEYVQPPQSDYTPPTTPSIKVMSAFITGTSSVSALISQEAIQIAAQIIVGTGAVAASAVREFVAATIAASSPTTTATITKDLSASISGSHSVTATMTMVMSATISSNVGDLSAAITKVLSSSLGGTSSVNAAFAKNLSAVISGSSTLTVGVAFGFSANIAGTSNVSSTLVKSISANVAATSTTQANMFRVMAASISASGNITAQLSKRLQANVTATSGTTANIVKAMRANVTGTTGVSANFRKNLAANINSVHNITAAINKGARANLSGTHTISANIRKIKYTSANISGGNTVTGNITKLKNMSATIPNNTGDISASIIKGTNISAYDHYILSNNPVVHVPLQETGTATVNRQLNVLPSTTPVTATLQRTDIQLGQTSILRGPSRSIRGGPRGAGVSVSTGLNHSAGNTFVLWTVPNSGFIIHSNDIDAASSARFSIFSYSGKVYVRFLYTIGSPIISRYLTFVTDNSFTANQSHCVVVTIDLSNTTSNSFVRIWVDGVRQDTTMTNVQSWVYNPSHYPQDSLVLGDGSKGGGYSTPYSFVERFSKFNTILSTDRIQTLYLLGIRTPYDQSLTESFPRFYLRLESYTDKAYLPSYARAGWTLTNGSTAGTYGSNPLTAYSYGGLSGQTMAVTSNIILADPTKLMFNSWIRLTALPSSSATLYSVRWSSGGASAFRVFINSSGALSVGLQNSAATASYTETFGTLNLNTIYMISVLYDKSNVSSRLRVFVNGIERSSTGSTSSGWDWFGNGDLPAGTQQEAFIGGDSVDTSLNVLQGTIERVSVHTSDFSNDKIMELYVTGTTT